MGDRLLRLGAPFVAVALIVAPLSYYPTYLQIAGHGGFVDFCANGWPWAGGRRGRCGSRGYCWSSIQLPYRCSGSFRMGRIAGTADG